jgi:CheY-like chemotaxis protein
MKINYKILWLDDEIDAFRDDEFVEKIQQYLEEKGFKPDIQTVSKVSDFFERLDDSFDLILTDYNMAEKNGAQVIADIRGKSIFTEILFYTAQAQWEEIGKLDRISFLQTNKISGGTHHQKVLDKAISIIDLTIKKFQHIVAMRGMIMHEVSSLDAQMLEIVSNYIDTKGDDAQNLKDKVLSELVAFHKEKLEKSERYKKTNTFDKVVKDPLLFSSSQRASALEEIVKSVGCENFIDEFRKEIIKVRNDFAHAVWVKEEETGREYFKDKNGGIDFNSEKCIEIRKNIIKHKANLDAIESKC